MSLLRLIILLYALALAAVNALAVDEPAALLTAAAVRQLTPEQAAQGQPVKVRGVVTYLSYTPPILFVQDETGGVCVSGTRDKQLRSELRVGTLVEVAGITAAGQTVPHVISARREPVQITIRGEGPLPEPRPVSLAQLGVARWHGDLLEVSGVVRSLRRESLGTGVQEALVITFASGHERREAVLLGWSPTKVIPAHWIGAAVRARGIFNSAFEDRLQIASSRLLINHPREVHIERPATPPSELPVRGMESLRDFLEEQPEERARVQGIVTLVVPGQGVFVQGAQGAVWAESSDNSALVPGNRVEVVGFPQEREWHVALEDAVWQTMERAAIPEATPVTAEQALSGAYDARRVVMEALLLETSRLGEGLTLVLQAGEKVFLARFADPAKAGLLRSLPENSWLQVTGVCVNNRVPQVHAGSGLSSASVVRPASFHLLLGGEDAVEVARAPSWWTLRRIAMVVGALVLVTALAFTWAVALRRRVAKQTIVIREHLARETIFEERVRIARELHDSLEQDLVGISMQLSATEKSLTEPVRARAALHLATAMVRRSQAETHRAVWDLREHHTGEGNLVEALQQAIKRLAPEGEPQVEIRAEGTSRRLLPRTENHLVRIASEAVTNVRKHARATHIEIAVEFAPESVTLRVHDDGCGFDSAQPPGPQAGHFGLFGMRERVDKLQGELSIKSYTGEGTEICVCVPITSEGQASGAVADSLDRPAGWSASPDLC